MAEKSPGEPCMICGELTYVSWVLRQGDLTDWKRIPCCADCQANAGDDLILVAYRSGVPIREN